MSDLISRESTLKHIEKIRQGMQMMDDTRRASIIMNGMYLCEKAVRNQPSAQPDLIAKIQNGINATNADDSYSCGMRNGMRWCISLIDDKEPLYENCPSAQPEIVRCKDCKHWRQQTNYQGAPLSFGFCESDDMWRSLYGETTEVSHIDTDDDFFCGYAERKTDDGE